MIPACLSAALTAFVSAFFPITPVEPYLVGLAAATSYSPIALGVAAAVGQTIGKTTLFLGARGAIRSARLRGWLEAAKQRRERRRAARCAKAAMTPTVVACDSGTPRPVAGADEFSAPAAEIQTSTETTGAQTVTAARQVRTVIDGDAVAAPPSWRDRLRVPFTALVATGRRLLVLLDRPALAAPILLLSATTGLPPLMAASIYAAGTRINLPLFVAACLVGRSIRFIAIAYAPQLVLS
jgi:membrane protein YqaA with SNARE-associated domain